MTVCQNSKGLLAISSAHFFLLWMLTGQRRFSPSCSPIAAQLMKVPHGSSWANLDLLCNIFHWENLGVFSMDRLTARRHLSEGPDRPEREAVDSLPLLVNCTITRLTVKSGIPRFWAIRCWLTPPSEWPTIWPLWKSESLCAPWIWGIVNCHTRPRNSFLQRKSNISTNRWVKLRYPDEMKKFKASIYFCHVSVQAIL